MFQPRSSAISLPAQAAGQRAARRGYVQLGWLAAALFVLTSLPYAYGALSAPDDHVFMGVVSDVPDTAQYFSWMRAHQDALVVSNWMTSEPNEPAFFNALWLPLGRLTAALGLDFAAALQLLRVGAGLAFAYALFWFAGMVAASQRERWLATLLVLIGGGVGWVWVVEKYLARRSELLFPLDVYVAEPNAFFSLIGFPHFLLAAALMLAVFALFLAGAQSGRFAPYGGAALLSLVLGVQHAYDLITIYFVLGALVLLRWWSAARFPWREAAGLTLIGVVSCPPAAYFVYLTSQNPIWRQVLAQFDNAGVFTPDPLHLLILLGPQLPLAATMLPSLLRRRQLGDLLLLAWTVVGFGLLYIPADFQIHMLNPYQVPLALLAIRALLRFAEAPGRWEQLRRAAPVGLVLLAALVNVYLLGWRMLDIGRHGPPYFLHRDEVAAIAWLDRQPGVDVVLADETLGQYVPALAAKRSVLAHWAQTVDYYTKRDAVARFFDPAAPAAERAATVQSYGVSYILVGEAEIERAGPMLDASFERVFSATHAAVYRVPER